VYQALMGFVMSNYLMDKKYVFSIQLSYVYKIHISSLIADVKTSEKLLFSQEAENQ
jgi:hypothetical protein